MSNQVCFLLLSIIMLVKYQFFAEKEKYQNTNPATEINWTISYVLWAEEAWGNVGGG